jgi:hypothetical protein
MVLVQFDSLSFWERVGVRALAQTAPATLAAGFRPQSVLARVNNGLKPEELFRGLPC